MERREGRRKKEGGEEEEMGGETMKQGVTKRRAELEEREG